MIRGLGIDIGGTKLLAAVREADGTVSHTAKYPTGRDFSPVDCVTTVQRAILEADATVGPVDGIGIGFPGLVDPHTGGVQSSVILDNWDDVPLTSLVQLATGLPCGIDNDVNNAARAELAERDDVDSFFFVAVGTGIGGAVVLNRSIWAGVGGLAGEFGHICIDREGVECICGRRGCVGPYAGGEGIESRLGISPGTLSAFMERNPDEVNDALVDAAQTLGSAIASALNIMNVPLVVLGGGLAALDIYRTNVEAAARAEAFLEIQRDCSFELPVTGYEAGAVGAAVLGQEVAKKQSENKRAA